MAGDALPPLRVGLVGCGRVGLHLIERSAVGGPFQVVAASEMPFEKPGARLSRAEVCADLLGPGEPSYGDAPTVGKVSEAVDVRRLIASFGVRLLSLSELAQSADIDVLWVTSFWEFPFECSPSEVFCGQHLIAETPFTLGNQAAKQAFADAAQRGRLLLIHHPRRADPEFRQAWAVARDEKIGAIRAVKFVLWSYTRPPRGASRGIAPSDWDENTEPGATKVRFVAHTLDQLMLLIPSRPISVTATSESGVSDRDLFAGDSLMLHIVFESGCQAEIDIRLASPTPFQSGWMLTGERGGYAKGRQYTLTDEGEVFDSPVTTTETLAEADQFEWLARQIRSGVPDAEEEARARSVVALLDAAQRSLATGLPVTLNGLS